MQDPSIQAINCLKKMGDLESEKDRLMSISLYNRSEKVTQDLKNIGSQMVSYSKAYLQILEKFNLDPNEIRLAYQMSQRKTFRLSSNTFRDENSFNPNITSWDDDENDEGTFFNDPLPNFLQKYSQLSINDAGSEWKISNNRRRR